MYSAYSEAIKSPWRTLSVTVPGRCKYTNKLMSICFSVILFVDVFAKDLSLVDKQSRSSKSSESELTSAKGALDLTDITNIPLSQKQIDMYNTRRNSVLAMVEKLLPPKIAEPAEKHKSHKIRRLSKKRLRKNSKRRKRHHKREYQNHEPLQQRSCQTRSGYHYMDTATDIFGDVVQVSPFIHIGNLSIVQYLYESFCDQEKCECSGIDNKNFMSSCETDFSFTYARVVKNGEIGWMQIKVRSGCSCKIHKVNFSGPINIVDLI